MPATFRCYQLKRSKDARKRCINLMIPKYSEIVAENKGFSSRNYLGLFLVDLGLFAIFCQASRYRARFQASSDHSDSANRPGYEADHIHQLCQVWAKSVIWALSPPAWFSHGHTLKSWFSNGYGYDQIPKQSQLVYLIHLDQLSMLIKSAENPSHFYHLSSFSNQASSMCLTQIVR